jgi:hypothetical protein
VVVAGTEQRKGRAAEHLDQTRVAGLARHPATVVSGIVEEPGGELHSGVVATGSSDGVVQQKVDHSGPARDVDGTPPFADHQADLHAATGLRDGEPHNAGASSQGRNNSLHARGGLSPLDSFNCGKPGH